MEWYWVAGIVAAIATLYYWFFVRQKGDIMGWINWLIGGGIIALLVLWWIDLFMFI